MFRGLIICPINHPIDIGVGLHLCAIEVQLLSPYQTSLDAQFHNVLEEQLEHIQSKSFTNFAQAAVIGDGLIQVITDEPTISQVEINRLH